MTPEQLHAGIDKLWVALGLTSVQDKDVFTLAAEAILERGKLVAANRLYWRLLQILIQRFHRPGDSCQSQCYRHHHLGPVEQQIQFHFKILIFGWEIDMFNRLAHNRGYLCGPMDRVRDGGVEWRDYLKKALSNLKVLWLDPCAKPIDIAIETPEVRAHLLNLKQEGQFEEFGSEMHTIAAVDLRMVHISDFLVVNLDLTVHAAGTYEEFTWVNQQKKPIIIRCAQGKTQAPSWVFGRIPHQMIFSN